MTMVSKSRLVAALALLVCSGAMAENTISPEPYIGRTVDDGQQMQLARYTTTLAKPHCSAILPVMISPVNINCLARAGPTR